MHAARGRPRGRSLQVGSPCQGRCCWQLLAGHVAGPQVTWQATSSWQLRRSRGCSRIGQLTCCARSQNRILCQVGTWRNGLKALQSPANLPQDDNAMGCPVGNAGGLRAHIGLSGGAFCRILWNEDDTVGLSQWELGWVSWVTILNLVVTYLYIWFLFPLRLDDITKSQS